MRVMLCVGVLAACAVASTPPPSPPRESKIALDVKSGILSNGLRVVLVHDPRASEIQVTMQYRVGAVDDPVGQEGMAHLVEHLMFQQVLGAQSLFARLETAATTFNATTRGEVTTYTTRARPERLDELLSIEAVRVGFRCTSISEATFLREREVVSIEMRQRDLARGVWRAIHDAVYPEGHPYRRTYADVAVAQMTKEQACIFADTYYTTTNAVLVVSGNVTPERVDVALQKFLGRVPKRESLARPISVPTAPIGQRVTVAAPFDEELLLFSWPLPAHPSERLKVQTVARLIEAHVDDAIRGAVMRLEIGDERAPVVGIVVLPRGPQGDIVKTVTERIAKLEAEGQRGSHFEHLGFSILHQRALYDVFAGFEEGSRRDEMLATGVHAGRDPRLAVTGASASLKSLTYEDASRVIREHLNTRRMSVATLKPRAGVKHGVPTTIETPVHDVGQRREPADPAEAKQPDTTASPPMTPLAKRELTLPNGLRVVLLPITSIPTVEIRLVFDSGTADEPANRRGAALFAARGLDWPAGYFAEYVNFASTGGTREVEVSHDSTAFIARGLDMHVDFMLQGLARWVRGGVYASKDLRAWRALPPDEDAAREDAWRAAMFGPQHPYTRGGLVRHIDPALTIADARAFHDTHHTPGNATLVIAGKFDAALAQRWLTHLFADWEGDAVPSGTQQATLQPLALAVDEDLAQTHVRIALPARGSRAAQLVLAQMLDEITGDVRHQLGASYGFHARLVEMRLSSRYLLEGQIEAPRVQEAIELVRTRIASLRGDPDAAARAFVSARKRAIARLRGLTSSAEEIAARVHADVSLGRAVMSDAVTLAEVQQLTIARMTQAIAELDLARSAILIRGPAASIDQTFAALGRTPRRIQETPRRAVAATTEDEIDEAFDVEDRPPPPGHRLMLGASTGVGVGQARTHDLRGFAAGAKAGYRIRRSVAVGLDLALTSFDGSYAQREFAPAIDISTFGLQVSGFIHATSHERFWGGLLAGAGLVRVTDDSAVSWHRAFVLGLEGGVDLAAVGGHRLGIYGRLDSDLLSDTSYAVFSVGLGYRR